MREGMSEIKGFPKREERCIIVEGSSDRGLQ
jgi:hypothetical protein